jgi:CBS domain containing-hemolysin-like protein
MTTPSHQTTDANRWSAHTVRRGLVRVIATVLCLAVPSTAHASFLSPELEDKLATILALVVIFIVPVVLIVLFWLVHILPEQIAHKRHHPQFEAIRTLCLLSLVFGGLLWPIAWIWAYSKPVLHKIAYGTDKAHADDDGEHSQDASTLGLHDRLARLEARGIPASELKAVRADLDALEAKFAGDEAP